MTFPHAADAARLIDPARRRTPVAAALVAASAVAASGLLVAPAVAAALPAEYGLVFQDDFDANTVSPTRIDPNGRSTDDLYAITNSTSASGMNVGDPINNGGGGPTPPAGPLWSNWQEGVHRRDAVNDPRAVSVDNGYMTIKTWSEANAFGQVEHHTGMVSTQGLFERAYGYYEARVKFNDSPGQWSAFWIYQDAVANNPSPTGATGVEMDIVEHRARDAGDHDISGQGSSNMHWNGYAGGHMGDYFHTGDLNLDEGFHTYGLLWTPEGYTFNIDGVTTWTADATPVSHADEYLILSSEVENNAWAGHIPGGGYGSFENSTTSMVIDYVKVYAGGAGLTPGNPPPAAGGGTPETPNPEPTTAGAVLLVAGLAGLKRRRRAI